MPSDLRGGEACAYIVVEKILGADEAMPADWGIDGTSGYDFMRDATALLHDPAGEASLRVLWRDLDPTQDDPASVVLQAKRDMLSWQFEAQLAACVAAFTALADSAVETDAALAAIPAPMWRRATERLLWVFPVYRTYGDGRTAPASDARARDQAWAAMQPHLPPGEAGVARRVLDWLAGDGPGDPALAAEAVRRFQQLSAPIAAKGVEDTAFYRRAPLLSANDVGSAPEEFAIAIDAFHHRAAARGRAFPHAMLASATHDHKRGEDARARLAVLSAVPDLWRAAVDRWSAMSAHHPDVHPADRYQLFQTLLGAWPAAGTPDADFPARIEGWLEKALREARLRSSWEAPDETCEGQAKALLAGLLGSSAFVADMTGFVAHIAPAALANSLAQTALKYGVPGVPDLYQGCEGLDLSLVDPDNRRPADYAARAALLAQPTGAEGEKIALIRDVLRHRATAPELFAQGSYTPLVASGQRSGNIVAFERRHDDRRLVCAVLVRAGRAIVEQGHLPDAAWWADTRIASEPDLQPARIFAERPYFINLR